MKRFWTLSLRARLMIIGLAGVGIALIMGGLAFFGALTYSVDRTLDNEALATAQEVAAMVNENRLPSPIPVSGAQVVQVVDAQQRVLGGSATADRLTPLLRTNELAKALSGEAVMIDGVRLGVTGPLRIRAIQASAATAPISMSSDCRTVTCSPRVLRCETLWLSRFRCCLELSRWSHGG
jgi:hypothetical protein